LGSNNYEETEVQTNVFPGYAAHLSDGGGHLCGRGGTQGPQGKPSDVSFSPAAQRAYWLVFSRHNSPAWFFNTFQPKLGIAGLFRDQRHRIDPDAGMPFLD
jgi:hypothetical protein